MRKRENEQKAGTTKMENIKCPKCNAEHTEQEWDKATNRYWHCEDCCTPIAEGWGRWTREYICPTCWEGSGGNNLKEYNTK